MRKAIVSAIVFCATVNFGFAQEVSLAKAIATAQSDGLTLIFGRAETKGSGSKVWGLYLMTPTRIIIEREISRSTGAIVVNKVIEEITEKRPINPKVVEILKERVLTKLPNSRYIEIAQGKSNGQAETFEMILAGDQVQIRVSGDGWDVIMDMATGKIVGGK